MQAIRANGALALRLRRLTGTAGPAQGSVLSMAADSVLERPPGNVTRFPGSPPPREARVAGTSAWDGGDRRICGRSSGSGRGRIGLTPVGRWEGVICRSGDRQ